jgi:hypothetical protein
MGVLLYECRNLGKAAWVLDSKPLTLLSSGKEALKVKAGGDQYLHLLPLREVSRLWRGELSAQLNEIASALRATQRGVGPGPLERLPAREAHRWEEIWRACSTRDLACESAGRHECGVRGLTFELTGPRRQDALARAERMYRVPQFGPRWPAVAGPVERVVRLHSRRSLLATTLTEPLVREPESLR